MGEHVGVGEHELSRKNWDIKDRNSSGCLSVREHRSTMCKVLALNPSAPYAYTHRQDRGCSNLFDSLLSALEPIIYLLVFHKFCNDVLIFFHCNVQIPKKRQSKGVREFCGS